MKYLYFSDSNITFVIHTSSVVTVVSSSSFRVSADPPFLLLLLFLFFSFFLILREETPSVGDLAGAAQSTGLVTSRS